MDSISSPEAQRNLYVLIDYENVGAEPLPELEKGRLRVFVFTGKLQKQLSAEWLATVSERVARSCGEFRVVPVLEQGKNALDFVLAFTLGQLVRDDPRGCFQIFSKDTGYDALVKYLRGTRQVEVKRMGPVVQKVALAPKPKIKPAVKKLDPELEKRIGMVNETLEKRGTSRPATVKTLESTLEAFFKTKKEPLSEAQLKELLQALESRGLIKVTSTKVTYPPKKNG